MAYEKYDGFEDWEDEYEIIEEQNWDELVEYRYRKAKENPRCWSSQWGLGDAYVRNGEYEKAINYLGELHIRDVKDLNVQYSILEALVAMGKDETDFDWQIEPKVLKLDESTLSYCFDYLRPKRKLITVEELYLECFATGYTMFTSEQLMRFLRSDSRFTLTGSENRSYDCYIATTKKSKKGK